MKKSLHFVDFLKYTMVLVLLVALNHSLKAQEKYEKEERIGVEEIPGPLIQKIESIYGADIKVKWYREISMNQTSIEAKFKFNKRLQSVEFDSTQNIEDIEITIPFASLEKKIKTNVLEYFNSTYSNHKILKVQKQLSGNEYDLKQAIKNNNFQNISVKYEIEYYGKTAAEKELWEGLFGDSGNIISKKKIVMRPTDNLNF